MGLKKADVQEFLNKPDNKFTLDQITQAESYLRSKGYEAIRILGAGEFGLVV